MILALIQAIFPFLFRKPRTRKRRSSLLLW